MKIIWAKWILERLPFSLRVNRIYVFCLLLTEPVRQLHAAFIEWSNKMRNKAGTTSQVCMLKKIANDELGINMEIEEGDGMPYDFIVKTSLTYTDKERQLFALLERYKMAGKSYLYVNELVAYSFSWEDYVCEVCEYSAEWSVSWVCERKDAYTINIAPYYYGATGSLLKITANRPLPRTVLVTAISHFGGADWKITLPVGFTAAEYTNANFDLQTLYITPREDDYYIFKMTNKNQ